MKIYPITNGTPDNAIEFFIIGSGDPAKVYEKCKALGFSEYTLYLIMWTSALILRFTIYGPDFVTLAEKAGLVDVVRQEALVSNPNEGEHAAQFTHRFQRPRTAAELCAWIAERLEGEHGDR